MTLDETPVPDDDLDGHTMEELSDYLDRDRTPYDPSIENSVSCRLALAAMTRMQDLSWTAMERESQLDPQRDNTWITSLLDTIKSETRSGRNIPVSHPNPALRLALTEAAVRGLIRRAGDTMGGVVMIRCLLDGDVEMPGEPIRIDVTVGLEYGTSVDAATSQLRERIRLAVEEHTELVIAQIDVTVDDIYPRERPQA